MADLFEKFSKNKGSLGQYQDKAHGYFAFPRLEGDISNRMIFQGKERVIWSLNNYLGLANHPEVRKADADAAAKYGLALPMGARIGRLYRQRRCVFIELRLPRNGLNR